MKHIIFFIALFNHVLIAQNKLQHDVYFETDKHSITDSEYKKLSSFIQNIQDIDIEKITIYGYCDDRGTENYNKVLSEKRANTIKDIFTNNEIDESIITSVDGKGEVLLRIIKNTDISDVRRLNRKVEITIIPIPKTESTSITDTQPNKKTIYSTNLKKGDKVILDNLLFKTGYARLTPNSKTVLKRMADTLVKRKELYFTIQGHVCCTKYSRDAIDRETKKRNLSIARAKFIYNYLAKKGIDKKRMKYVGMRRKFPLGGDPKYDRRVEILITHVADKND